MNDMNDDTILAAFERGDEDALRDFYAKNFSAVCGYWHHMHTAWQWISMGYVPLEDAIWRNGDSSLCKSEDYYYCHLVDVHFRPSEAKEKLLLYNKMVEGMELPPPLKVYDGRPWWEQN